MGEMFMYRRPRKWEEKAHPLTGFIHGNLEIILYWSGNRLIGKPIKTRNKARKGFIFCGTLLRNDEK